MFTTPQHIYTKCNDGFCNQFRMLLAGEFLVQEKYIQSYTQEWTTTNHNNIDFLNFFEPPKFVQIKNIPQDQINCTDGAFAGMTGKYVEKNGKKWLLNLRSIFNTLRLKENIQQLVNKHLEKINCKNIVGIHVRRTCKISANKAFKRTSSLLSNQQFLNILNDYNLKVYVATDNKETQEFFKQKLKDRCIVYQDILNGTQNYCSDEYIRENVARFTEPLHTIIDFYSLLNCKRFLGTESSSFTALVYHLRNIADDYKITTLV